MLKSSFHYFWPILQFRVGGQNRRALHVCVCVSLGVCLCARFPDCDSDSCILSHVPSLAYHKTFSSVQEGENLAFTACVSVCVCRFPVSRYLSRGRQKKKKKDERRTGLRLCDIKLPRAACVGENGKPLMSSVLWCYTETPPVEKHAPSVAVPLCSSSDPCHKMT